MVTSIRCGRISVKSMALDLIASGAIPLKQLVRYYAVFIVRLTSLALVGLKKLY